MSLLYLFPEKNNDSITLQISTYMNTFLKNCLPECKNISEEVSKLMLEFSSSSSQSNKETITCKNKLTVVYVIKPLGIIAVAVRPK